MREIGGFLELELNRGRGYHADAQAFNLGRTAFEYLLRSRRARKVYVPYFACGVIAEAAVRAGTEVVYYNVNESLEPLIEPCSPGESEYFLYINYFGIKAGVVKRLSGSIPNLIIDNSQAFFDKPLPGIDTFYSARKFFGVPDGGYLYTEAPQDPGIPVDNSSARFAHLIGRIENGASESYPFFRENETVLSLEPVKKMSAVTGLLLGNIEYETARERRIRNFNLLHDLLGSKNMLAVEPAGDQVPLAYPFLTMHPHLREMLREYSIYTPVYWQDVLPLVSPGTVEHSLVTGIVPLPADQRYGEEEMNFIAKTVLKNV
jgi:hypothetical protein